MLAVEGKRRKYWVDITPDDGRNKGGYFCRVYNDPNGESYEDCFTIDKKEIPRTIVGEKERLTKAKTLALYKTKERLNVK